MELGRRLIAEGRARSIIFITGQDNEALWDEARQLLECVPAWDGNWTWNCFLVFAWQGAGERLLVTVNYAPNQSQCHVRLPFADLGDSRWRLKDLLGDATYDWAGNDLQGRGLYLDESPWKASVFSLTNVQGG
jgi:hypothetical protein